MSGTHVTMEYNLSELALLYLSGFHADLLHCSPSSLISEGTWFGAVPCGYSTADTNADDGKTEPSWLHRFMSSDGTTKSLGFTH